MLIFFSGPTTFYKDWKVLSFDSFWPTIFQQIMIPVCNHSSTNLDLFFTTFQNLHFSKLVTIREGNMAKIHSPIWQFYLPWTIGKWIIEPCSTKFCVAHLDVITVCQHLCRQTASCCRTLGSWQNKMLGVPRIWWHLPGTQSSSVLGCRRPKWQRLPSSL